MNVMDKITLLDRYVDAKGWTVGATISVKQAGYRCWHLQTGGDTKVKASRCEYQNKPDENPHENARNSFIVQVLELDHETVLLLDSTDVRYLPNRYSFLRGGTMGGVWGGISDVQAEIVKQLLPAAGAKPVVIGTHMPIDALDEYSQQALEKIVDRLHAFALFSAHTHDATSDRPHNFQKDPKRSFLELNIGSVASWPMEYLYVSVDQSTLTVDIDSAGWELYGFDCHELARNKLVPEDYDYYTHYKRNRGYAKIMRAMLANERRYFASRSLPPNLEELEIIGTRPEELTEDVVLQAAVRQYERCQAIFASAAEGDHDPDAREESSGEPDFFARSLNHLN